MSSKTSMKHQTPVVMPIQKMRGHTDWVRGVVHLPGGRRIITCSDDDSLRLWDLESGAQIGEDWRDEGEEDTGEEDTGVFSIALSPNGKTVVSGCRNGKVKLWDVKTGKVVAKWTGHANGVTSMCWSAGGNRVVSGSRDGTARVWNVKSGETILEIKTEHVFLWEVIYSPDNIQIATGGFNDGVKIWNAKTGELIKTLKHDWAVLSLARTSDGKKLITASYGPIRIFDAATWKQIATLQGHTNHVNSTTLSRNNRLLASTSSDRTARLWNLNTNLPVGPPLQHIIAVYPTALSSDGKWLVIGSYDTNAYAWDIHAILKQVGLEDLLQPSSDVLTRKSLKDSGATRRPPIQAHRISPGFFDGAQNGPQSSMARSTHPRSFAYHPRHALAPSSANLHAFLERLSSFSHHSRSHADAATELQQRPARSIFSRGPRIVEVATVQDRKSLAVAPWPRPQQQSQSHVQSLSSQSQPTATSTSSIPAQGTNTTTAGATAQSPPIPLLARLVLFLCCASPPHANVH